MSTDTVGVHMFLGESLPPSLVLLRPIRDCLRRPDMRPDSVSCHVDAV